MAGKLPLLIFIPLLKESKEIPQSPLNKKSVLNNKKHYMKRIILLFLLLCTSLHFLNAQIKGVEGKNGKWGLVDGAGKMITQSIYESMGNYGKFSEGLAAVTINKKSGYIDTTGKIIIPLKYAECNKFKYGTATVWIGDFCGLIDKTGKILIPVKYSSINNEWDEAAVTVSVYNKITEQSKYGLFTTKGKELLPVSYDEIGEIQNGISLLKQAKYYGYYLLGSKVIIPCKYDEAKNFTEGFAAVAVNKKWGYIDMNGKVIIPFEYDYVRPLENGYAEVRKNGVSNILSKQLKTNTPAVGKKEYELVITNLKQIPVPSIESDVVPGVFTMKVPAALKQQSGDLYGHVSIYSDGSTFLYFKKDDNKTAISYLNAMLQFKQFKTRAGFNELGSINYSSPSKISFVGFYGVMPDKLKRKDMETEEAYVFFSKPGNSNECWILHYLLGKESIVQIEKEIELFLETVKVK